MERTGDRSGRRVRAIRVYTLCQESRYVFRFHLVADFFAYVIVLLLSFFFLGLAFWLLLTPGSLRAHERG
jgi:hypothetical protein